MKSNRLICTIAAFITSILIQGCATVGNSGLRGKDPLNLQDNGIVFITLGYAKTVERKISPFGSYSINFTGIDNKSIEQSFYAIPDNMFNDSRAKISTMNAEVEVTGIELKPGKYEVQSYGAYTDAGAWKRSMKSSRSFKLPFEVKKGEITYLGSFLLIDLGGASIYAVTNEFERDFQKLLSLRPELGKLQTNLQLLGSDEKDAVFPVLKNK